MALPIQRLAHLGLTLVMAATALGASSLTAQTLNVGSDAGVTAGMTFELYRGSTYKGQVRVQKVLNNMCSALIVRPVAGQTVGQGDSASTRL